MREVLLYKITIGDGVYHYGCKSLNLFASGFRGESKITKWKTSYQLAIF